MGYKIQFLRMACAECRLRCSHKEINYDAIYDPKMSLQFIGPVQFDKHIRVLNYGYR
jgi:hypothetical protein